MLIHSTCRVHSQARLALPVTCCTRRSFGSYAPAPRGIPHRSRSVTNNRENVSAHNRTTARITPARELQQVLKKPLSNLGTHELLHFVQKSQELTLSHVPHHDESATRAWQSGPQPEDIALALTRLSSTKKNMHPEDFCLVLSALASCLHSSPHDAFSPVQLTRALASLDQLPPSLPEVQSFLLALGPKTAHCTTEGRPTTPNELLAQLGILRRCHEPWLVAELTQFVLAGHSSPDFATQRRRVLCAATSSSATPPATSAFMSRLLFNMHRLPVTDPQVLLLLNSVASWIRESPHAMVPAEWSRALGGLAGMNSSVVEVTNVLSAVADKMLGGASNPKPQRAAHTDPLPAQQQQQQQPLEFTPEQLGLAMYGIRFMDSKHPAVDQVLSNIAAAVKVRARLE